MSCRCPPVSVPILPCRGLGGVEVQTETTAPVFFIQVLAIKYQNSGRLKL